MSLIELMVGLVIALVLSLIMFKTLLYAEGQRRTTSSGNDAQQAGTLGSYQLERNIRMGGAGFDSITNARGCKLVVTNSNGTTIPLPAVLSPPFAGLVGQVLPLAPVLIANGGVNNNNTATSTTPDAVIVMGGTHASINTWFQMTTSGTSTSAQVLNTLGLLTGDKLLAIENAGTSPMVGICTMAQTTSTINTTSTSPLYLQSTSNGGLQIDLGGALTSSTGFTNYSASSQIADLGVTPLFTIYGVGSSSGSLSQLTSYDMLGGTMQDFNDGVVNLQAVYGLADTPASTIVTTWQAPVGAFSLSTLSNLSAASTTNIQRIRAIRLAMITRSAIQEKNPVEASPTLIMFPDLASTSTSVPVAAAVTVTHTGVDLYYRYRLFDVLIPLRNH